MAAVQTSGARPLEIPATKHPDAPWNGSGYLQGLKVDIVQWLGWLTWIGLAVCIVALIMFGAALALDKERGEAISATAPHMVLLRIGVAAMLIGVAGQLGYAIAR